MGGVYIPIYDRGIRPSNDFKNIECVLVNSRKTWDRMKACGFPMSPGR